MFVKTVSIDNPLANAHGFDLSVRVGYLLFYDTVHVCMLLVRLMTIGFVCSVICCANDM